MSVVGKRDSDEFIQAPLKKARVAPDASPNVVSATYTTLSTKNYAEVVVDFYPRVAVYAPYLDDCFVCQQLQKKFEFWYQNTPERLLAENDHVSLVSYINLETLASMDETLLEREAESNFESHLHAFVLNEEQLTLLPSRPKTVPRKPKVNEPGLAVAVAAVTPVIEPTPVEPLASWWERVLKALKQRFFVRHENGHVSSWASFSKFTPWDYQEPLATYVAEQFNWKEAIEKKEHYKPTLLYQEMGTGKTPQVLYAFQRNPPPNVDIVCDISLIDTRWVEELYHYFPALHGTTVYRIYGYSEFNKQLRTKQPHLTWEHAVVLDEEQEFRSLTPGMLADLAALRESIWTILLTGTWAMNQLTDIYGLNVIMEIAPLETMQEILDKHELYATLNFDPKLVKQRYGDNVYHYMTTSPTKGYYRYFYEQYKGRVFYFRPSSPIKTETEEIRVPMTWHQAYAYIGNSKQTIDWGPISVQSGIRNAFDTMLRRVSNCLLDESDEKILCAPKLDLIASRIEQNKRDRDSGQPSPSLFPMIIFSKFKKRGVIAMRKKILEKKLKLKVAILTGDTPKDERDEVCNRFNRGEIDILLLSKVGRRGLNLTGCKTIVILEIPDSDGEKRQTIARCLRWGLKEQQIAAAIHIWEMNGVFPVDPPTAEEIKHIHGLLIERIGRHDAEEARKIDVIKEMRRHMEALRLTIDQRCAERNPEKAKAFEMFDLVVKAASIQFKDIPSRFYEQLSQLI